MEQLVILVSLFVIYVSESEGGDIQALLEASLFHQERQRVFRFAFHKGIKTDIFENNTHIFVLVILILRLDLFLQCLL